LFWLKALGIIGGAVTNEKAETGYECCCPSSPSKGAAPNSEKLTIPTSALKLKSVTSFLPLLNYSSPWIPKVLCY